MLIYKIAVDLPDSLKDEDWLFKHGKHAGKKLSEVAVEDPTYLQWVFAKASDNFTDEAFHALEDVMEEFKIEFP